MSLQIRVEGDILLLGMANPPVNCLSLDLRRQLLNAFAAAATDHRVAAIVLYGAGKYFCAGGDLRELGTPAEFTAPRLSAELLPCIERGPKPVVAAIHGGAIGGGFELALACHCRVALSDARIALPELKHGIIPLSGSLRLPRLWGIARAMPMMLHSGTVMAEDFRGSEVFDCLVDSASLTADDAHAALLAIAIAIARSVVNGSFDGTLVRNRPFIETDPRAALAQTLERHGRGALTAAQSALIAAVRAGIEMEDFDAALAQAQQIYDDLVRSVSKLT